MTDDRSGEPTIAEMFAGLARDIWRRRRLFAVALVLGAVVSIALALALPRRYRAEASIMPPAEQRGVGGMLSSFGSLAGLAGLGTGGTSSDLYPAVVRSDRILDAAINHPFGQGTLRDVLLHGQAADSTRLYELRLALQDKIQATKSIKSGVVTISYEHRNRYFAAAMVNALLGEIEGYFGSEMAGEVRMQRRLLEQRIASITDSLAVQEERLQYFQVQNRDARQSPRLALDERRLERDLNLSSGVYGDLMRQYELVKIQDSAQMPVLRVLDRASVPMIHFWPQRRPVVLAGLVLSFAAAFAWMKVTDGRQRA